MQRGISDHGTPSHGRGRMTEFARLELDGRTYELPILVGTEGERAIDISKLRAQTGYITLDDGYVNTGSCQSAITFIDGDEGILRYRGIPIETLAERIGLLADGAADGLGKGSAVIGPRVEDWFMPPAYRDDM